MRTYAPFAATVAGVVLLAGAAAGCSATSPPAAGHANGSWQVPTATPAPSVSRIFGENGPHAGAPRDPHAPGSPQPPVAPSERTGTASASAAVASPSAAATEPDRADGPRRRPSGSTHHHRPGPGRGGPQGPPASSGLCDTAAQQGGLPGNLYTACRKIYG